MSFNLHFIKRRCRWFTTSVATALNNKERNYTRGPVRTAVILLAIPMVLEMVMESIFVVVDIYWVSKLGAEAVAAVGITEALITVVYAVAIGLSMATTAMVARRIGEDQPKAGAIAARRGAKRVVKTAIEAFGRDGPRPMWSEAQAARIFEEMAKDAEELDVLLAPFGVAPFFAEMLRGDHAAARLLAAGSQRNAPTSPPDFAHSDDLALA